MPDPSRELPDAPLGPYAPDSFRLATGASADGGLPAAARHLFATETIAVPESGPFAECGRAVAAFRDLADWSARPGPATRPPLVWIGAPERIAGARVLPDGRAFENAGRAAPLALVARIALNRSWADASTFDFLSRRPVTMRGATGPDGGFLARTLWPEDWRLERGAPAVAILGTRSPRLAIRGLARSAPRGGAASPPETHLLWEREPGRHGWAGRPVLAFVLNGAQGDDDEAWGGHFAIATGRLPHDGRLSDLLVSNFYTLETENEKGILPAPVPLDGYLADLNSGQSWYRPSYIALAVLRDDRALRRIEGAMHRLYLQFWRRQLAYRHSTMNCAGITIDALRAIGWAIPARGPSAALGAWLAVPAKAFTDASLEAARNAFEYLREDRTRLMPSAAFEESVLGLLGLARRGPDPDDGALAAMLAEDLLAVAGVRLPQIPSSRALGTWPAANPREYVAALPRDPLDLRVVPVPPRPFPGSLRDPDLLPAPARPSWLPLALWTLTGVLPLAWLAGHAWRALRRAAR